MKKNLLQKGIILSAAICHMAGTIWSGTLLASLIVNIIWIAAILVALILRIISTNGHLFIKKQRYAYHIWLVLFLGICFASVLWAYNVSYAQEKAFFILRIVLSVFVLSFIFDDVDLLLETIELGGHFAVLAFYIANGIMLVVAKMILGSRLGDAGLNGNTLGMAATTAILISLYFILKNGVSLKNVLIPPSLLIVAVSQSRKAIISLFGGVLLLLFLNRTKKKQLFLNILRAILYMAAGAFAIYVIINLPFMSFAKARLEGLIAGFFGSTLSEVDSSTQVRLILKDYGKSLFLNNPILGVGLDNARFFNPYGLYLHNNYLEMLANLGIIGFAVYYIPYAVAGIRFFVYRDTKDRQYNICLVLLIILLVMDYGQVSYYNLSQYFLLFVIYLKGQSIKSQYLKRKKTA